jgi:hypothetical protein
LTDAVAGALTLDHVGLVGADLAAMATAFRRLGLTPTEPRTLSRLDPATGRPQSLHQQSCHIVLPSGYIELTSVAGDDPAHHLAAWRSRGAGAHILALGTEQVAACHDACVSSGLAVTAVARASRPVDYGSRHGDAVFDWFMFAPDETPEALICLVHNRTPALVYQHEVMQHALGAIALDEVALLTPNPRSFANRHAGWLGAEWGRDRGCRVKRLATGCLSLGNAEAMTARWRCDFSGARWHFGGIAAIALRVADLDAARRLLQMLGILAQGDASELIIAPTDAAGVVLALRA